MAEGHAVIRWKQRLQPLVGHLLREVRMPKRWGDRPQTLVGERVMSIDTHGKHLLLNLSTGETLHCHGAQYGSWQVGEAPLDYRKPEHFIRLRLLTDSHEAVFYHGPTVELLTPDERATHPRLTSLGPDVMAADFDRTEAARRIRAEGSRPIGPTVLDQRVVAGIGNIYKSEGLFLVGVDPERPAQDVSDDELEALWNALIPLMWEGTKTWGRTKTTPPALRAEGEDRWVYQRKGKPCLRKDGGRIELLRLPPYDRATYRCPVCQH